MDRRAVIALVLSTSPCSPEKAVLRKKNTLALDAVLGLILWLLLVPENFRLVLDTHDGRLVIMTLIDTGSIATQIIDIGILSPYRLQQIHIRATHPHFLLPINKSLVAVFPVVTRVQKPRNPIEFRLLRVLFVVERINGSLHIDELSVVLLDLLMLLDVIEGAL